MKILKDFVDIITYPFSKLNNFIVERKDALMPSVAILGLMAGIFLQIDSSQYFYLPIINIFLLSAFCFSFVYFIASFYVFLKEKESPEHKGIKKFLISFWTYIVFMLILLFLFFITRFTLEYVLNHITIGYLISCFTKGSF